MKKILVGLTALIVACVAPLFVSTSASQQSPGSNRQAPPSSEEEFIRGRVVCRTCYLKDNRNGVGIYSIAHEGVPEYDEGQPEQCAVICSKKGMPLALLTRDNKLYTITGKLAEAGDVDPAEGSAPLRKNEPNAGLVTHIGHTLVVFGKVTEKNGEMQIESTRRTWNSDSKDWRVDSTLEVKHATGGSQIVEGEDKK
jgi:hypothetical protein